MKRYSLLHYVSSVVFASLLIFLLAPCSAVHAQGQWHPAWVPCDANGTPLPSSYVGSNGLLPMSGTFTGSASGSQTMPYSVTGFYFYDPSPLTWIYSAGGGQATYQYDPWSDDVFVGFIADANNGAWSDGEDADVSITSNSAGSISEDLHAYFLWQPYYTDGTDSPSPPPGSMPAPPSSASFLLQTVLQAGCTNTYLASPDVPTSGLSSSADVSDDQFGESLHVVAPPPPYAYSRGNYNTVTLQSGGGNHLVSVPVKTVNGQGIYDIHLSGTASAQAVNGMDHNKYNHASAYASASLDGGAKPFNIQLVQPDPNTDPTLGDGTNQFVYSADTPDGYLYIPGAIQVVGGTHADAQFLLDNNLVDLKIENSPVPNTFVHQWAISGNTIYVNTPQNTDNPYPGYQFNHWIFKGLPTASARLQTAITM